MINTVWGIYSHYEVNESSCEEEVASLDDFHYCLETCDPIMWQENDGAKPQSPLHVCYGRLNKAGPHAAALQ